MSESNERAMTLAEYRQWLSGGDGGRSSAGNPQSESIMSENSERECGDCKASREQLESESGGDCQLESECECDCDYRREYREHHCPRYVSGRECGECELMCGHCGDTGESGDNCQARRIRESEAGDYVCDDCGGQLCAYCDDCISGGDCECECELCGELERECGDNCRDTGEALADGESYCIHCRSIVRERSGGELSECDCGRAWLEHIAANDASEARIMAGELSESERRALAAAELERARERESIAELKRQWRELLESGRELLRRALESGESDDMSEYRRNGAAANAIHKRITAAGEHICENCGGESASDCPHYGIFGEAGEAARAAAMGEQWRSDGDCDDMCELYCDDCGQSCYIDCEYKAAAMAKRESGGRSYIPVSAAGEALAMAGEASRAISSRDGGGEAIAAAAIMASLAARAAGERASELWQLSRAAGNFADIAAMQLESGERRSGGDTLLESFIANGRSSRAAAIRASSAARIRAIRAYAAGKAAASFAEYVPMGEAIAGERESEYKARASAGEARAAAIYSDALAAAANCIASYRAILRAIAASECDCEAAKHGRSSHDCGRKILYMAGEASRRASLANIAAARDYRLFIAGESEAAADTLESECESIMSDYRERERRELSESGDNACNGILARAAGNYGQCES